MLNVTKIIDAGNIEKDQVTFYVANQIFEGFKNVRLTRSLTALTGSFEIVITDKFRIDRQDFELKPGVSISCKLGATDLFKGYIDHLTISRTASSRNFTISGRDKTSDLVDCSVVGQNEYNNMRLEAIAKQLLVPFGLGLIVFSDTGAPFQKFTIQQGETVFEALQRLAKQRDLLMTTSPVGNLIFEKKGVVRSSTELVEGVNVLSSGVTFDNSERFSDYFVKSQTPGIIGSKDDATKAKGSAKDLGIDRYRPLLILSDGSADSASAEKRAAWEASMRAAKATELNVVTNGWRQKNGELWAVNQTVAVDINSVGIKQDMLIKTVKFELADKGKITELELIRPDAFEFDKEVKKESDPLDLLGWDSK